MTLKTRWLVTVSLTTLVLVAAGSLVKTSSQQLWSPEVAHAARVTANLLKGQSMRPVFLHRVKPLSSQNGKATTLPDKKTGVPTGAGTI